MNPHHGGDVFDIFVQQQPQRPAARPPGLFAPFVADHSEWNERDVWHGVRQFDDRARHMIVRRYHDQRFEVAFMRPAPCLRGIAAGVDGGIVEIDAAIEQRLALRHGTGDFAGAAGRMHPGDQQPLAVARGQQFHRVRDARGAARQNDDAVGPAFRLHLDTADLGQERNEADRRHDERDRHDGNGCRVDASRRRIERRIRRCIVGVRSHAMAGKRSSPRRDFRRFSGEVETVSLTYHSISSSVANSVRRDAQAVIAAIITACTASTR